MGSFWTDKTIEPKRKFKFLLNIPGNEAQGLQEFLVKTAGKPSFETTATEHTFLNHFFYFPGKTKWSPIEVKVVDAVNTGLNTSQAVMKLLERSGYKLPTTIDSNNPNSLNVASKEAAVNALGDISIKTLDADGNVVEEWVMKNAWIQKANFGDLDYNAEDLTEVTFTIQYDFAFLQVAGAAQIPAS